MKFSACGIEDMPKYENLAEYVILNIERDTPGSQSHQTFTLPWNTTWHQLEQYVSYDQRLLRDFQSCCFCIFVLVFVSVSTVCIFEQLMEMILFTS